MYDGRQVMAIAHMALCFGPGDLQNGCEMKTTYFYFTVLLQNKMIC